MKLGKSKKHILSDCIDAVFVVDGEMIKDNGEDSYSFSVKEDIGYISVFDGCGGIGSRKYETYGGKSGAYIASRACANAIYDYFGEISVSPAKITANTFPEIARALKDIFTERLSAFDSGSRQSLIKGSLAKNFPTTMSGILFKYEQKRYSYFFTWAGDSRGFILTPSGLTQVTKDDVNGSEDALSNLKNDGNLANFISADGRFELNHTLIKREKQSVVITATDGCFGYFSTPMEFEYMLLDTLIHSSSINEWKETLNEYILKYTGDDYTMAIAVAGFGSFKKLKKMFLKRHKILYTRYISKLDGVTSNSLHDMWREYKKVYYRKYSGK
ncbi:MAG: hypothetical protein E7628_01970 [Ruminococcaceae bacterium]|nr:hypothetical protein [Oscillospiraceae bacterium]